MSSPTTKSKLRQFFEQGARVRFKKGEIIARPGEPSQHIYFITSGYVKVYYLHKSGQESIQLILQKGEFFPGRWLIHYKEDDLYYEALTDLRVLRRKKSELRTAMEEDAGLLSDVTEYTFDIFRYFMDRLRSIQQRSAYGRLVSYLLTKAGRFGTAHMGKKQNGTTKIMCPLTHQTIASSIGASRETVSREFEKLKAKNIVAYDEQSHLIIILDMERLRQEAE